MFRKKGLCSETWPTFKVSKNPSTRLHFDALGVPQPKNTFGELQKLCISIDRKVLLNQPYSKPLNMIFWNQKFITKCITESVQNVIKNLDRSRKTLQNIRGFIIYRLQTKIPIEKGSTLFRDGGSFEAICLNFPISWKLSLVWKNSVWMIQMALNSSKRKVSIR